MTTSEKGRNLIKEFEGLKLSAYRCPAGVPTIGWGHTAGVRMGMTITEAQAEKYLTEDIRPLEKYINQLGINLRQGQFDALVSWLFNLGTGNFSKSTLRKKILAGADDEEIADEFRKWVKSGKRVLSGLVRRRDAEVKLWCDD